MTARPPRLFDDFTPIHTTPCLEFARRELTDERLAHWMEAWT